MESILTNIKKLHNVEEDDTSFDIELTIHINSVLFILGQLGVGPKTGYAIKDKEDKWSDLIGTREDLESIRTYIYLKTKLVFDPPLNSFLVTSIEKTCTEYEWRIREQV